MEGCGRHSSRASHVIWRSRKYCRVSSLFTYGEWRDGTFTTTPALVSRRTVKSNSCLRTRIKIIPGTGPVTKAGGGSVRGP